MRPILTTFGPLDEVPEIFQAALESSLAKALVIQTPQGSIILAPLERE